MTSKVLFVDDEPLTLESYAAYSDDLRDAFEIRTANNGVEALATLETFTADIVVSDLEMPEMNGGELLSTVERKFPEMMRVVVSGDDSALSLARCLMFGHRYLRKPVRSAELMDVLRRVSRQKALIANDKIKRILGKRDALPSPPETYLHLTEALHHPNANLEEYVGIIERDPASTAKLLQIVNSSYFGFPGRITSAFQAIQLLGVETLRGLILYLHTKGFVEQKAKNRTLLASVWNHSLETAVCAQKIARTEGLSFDDRQTCFTAGLLHDAGKIVFLASPEVDYADIATRALMEKKPVHLIEKQELGATHADVGAYLLGLWGLPEEIVSCAEQHHSLEKMIEPSFSPVICVHAAQNLSPDRAHLLNLDVLGRLGLATRIPLWKQSISESN